ncbi:gas vesicle protein, partial [Micromonospora azadirachtae]
FLGRTPGGYGVMFLGRTPVGHDGRGRSGGETAEEVYAMERIRGDGGRTRRREPEPEDEWVGDEEYVEPLSAAEAAREGLRQVVELTGRDPVGTTSLKAVRDGWLVGVEVIEDRRIPASTDLLGLYEVELDIDGALLGYRRVRRYQRGKGEVG